MPRTDFTWEPNPSLACTFDVPYTVTPVRPAVTNADPSQCHPEEGGIEHDPPKLKRAEVYLIDNDTPHLV